MTSLSDVTISDIYPDFWETVFCIELYQRFTALDVSPSPCTKTGQPRTSRLAALTLQSLHPTKERAPYVN